MRQSIASLARIDTLYGFLKQVMLLLLLLVGCMLIACPAPTHAQTAKASASDMAYARAYKALMVRYRDDMRRLASRPLPPKTLPKAERKAKARQLLRDIATANSSYAKKLRQLKPPAYLREVNEASAALLQTIAEETLQDFPTRQNGNKAGGNSLEQTSQKRLVAAAQRLQRAVKQLGRRSPEIEGLIRELNGKP